VRYSLVASCRTEAPLILCAMYMLCICVPHHPPLHHQHQAHRLALQWGPFFHVLHTRITSMCDPLLSITTP
jgi:hypothetical protein